VLLVSIAAAAAAAVAVGGAIATRVDRGGGEPRSGLPPLALDLGVRTDPEAVALRRASDLYDGGRARAAQTIFLRYDSPQARVGSALSHWPAGSVPELEGLAEEVPRDPVVLLNLGLARIWSGDDGNGVAALRQVKRVAPDTLSAVRADNVLHPEDAPGLPTFVPSFAFPPEIARLSPPRQLAELARRARRGGVRDRIRYGVALQRLGRPLSARRVYAAAARLAHGDAEAQVAAAVGWFDKERPQEAFSRLGPLTKRFPGAPTVRFHLGVLLLWIGQVDEAKRQLRLAARSGAGTTIGREAARFLDRLGGVGTG
jgi:tetratricopeptide (TPR) repeat protein